MTKEKGYQSTPLPFMRRMVIASISSNKKNTIHCVTEIDISKPRNIIRENYVKTGEKLSFTAYIVKCFAEAITYHRELNSFIKGRKLILLDDITVSVLIERELKGKKIPEPLGIKKVQEKTVKQLHDEIRAAQKNAGDSLGDLNKMEWIRFIPPRLLRLFVKIADSKIKPLISLSLQVW